MIKKIMVVLSTNIMLSVTFTLVSWALVDTYRTGEWLWFIFFAFFLPFYILKLARISTFYDEMKRQGKV